MLRASHLLCHHLGEVTVVKLHQPVTLLKLTLDKLGSNAVSAGAPAEALEQVADDADSVLLLFLPCVLLTLVVLHLQAQKRARQSVDGESTSAACCCLCTGNILKQAERSALMQGAIDASLLMQLRLAKQPGLD